MLAAQAILAVHVVVAFAIVLGWFLLALWGGLAYFSKRPPADAFYRMLRVLEGLLGLQLVVGLILWASNPLPTTLHPFYGAVFPAIVLVIAEVLGRGMGDSADRWKVYAVAVVIVFLLTGRAMMTGFLHH